MTTRFVGLLCSLPFVGCICYSAKLPVEDARGTRCSAGSTKVLRGIAILIAAFRALVPLTYAVSAAIVVGACGVALVHVRLRARCHLLLVG